MPDEKQWKMHLTVTDTELKHLDWFQGFSQDKYFAIPGCLKTCRLYASFVSPLQFFMFWGISRTIINIKLNIIPADAKVACLMLR